MASSRSSRSARCPVRTRDRSTRASEHSMRSASCSFDISSENTRDADVAAERGVLGEVQGEGRVVHAHVVGDEVVRVRDRQVVDLARPDGPDRDELVPRTRRWSRVAEYPIARRPRVAGAALAKRDRPTSQVGGFLEPHPRGDR